MIASKIRMRVAKDLVAEIKLLDPMTPITICGVRRLVREGKLKHVKVGKKVLINLDFFLQFLNNQFDLDETTSPPSEKSTPEIKADRMEQYRRNIGLPINGK